MCRYEKDVQPVVLIVIKEGHTTARGFEQKAIFVLSAVDGLYVQSAAARNIDKTVPQRSGRYRGGLELRGGPRRRAIGGSRLPSCCCAGTARLSTSSNASTSAVRDKEVRKFRRDGRIPL